MFRLIRPRYLRNILPLALFCYLSVFLVIWRVTVFDNQIRSKLNNLLYVTNASLQLVLQASHNTVLPPKFNVYTLNRSMVIPWNYWDLVEVSPIKNPDNITILMWTKYYNNMDLTEHIRNESPIPDWCNVTFDRNKRNESQAIVFHMTGRDFDPDDVPPRFPNQPWVYYTIEPPVYMAQDSNPLSGLFNRTMTYRLDSDYPCPYGFLKKLKTPVRQFLRKFAQEKTTEKKDLIAWMVSHCSTTSQRELIVKKLQEYVPVHVYGSCGTYHCDPKDEEGCYKKLGQRYKFYLAFENSLCKDYITEKFSNALRYGMIPVVYGGGNYSAILPFPKSFIQVKDFRTVKDLANFLTYLDRNHTAFLEYFEWQKFYKIHIRQGFGGFRRMCFALQYGDHNRKKNYQNVKRWYVDEGNCISPSIARKMAEDMIKRN